MLEWAAKRRERCVFDGTVGSLLEWYFNAEDSSYRELKSSTAKDYKRHVKPLQMAKAALRVEDLKGTDVQRWYKELQVGRTMNTAHRIIEVFKTAISFGSASGIDACTRLRAQLAATRFKKGERRNSRLTRAHVEAFRAVAAAAGRPSMALGVTLQFEFGMRQRDIIGEWVDAPGADGIRNKEGKRWVNGLTGMLFDDNGHLVKRTTKTGTQVEHTIDDHPELAAMLKPMLAINRGGPLVINETSGQPYSARTYRFHFREIARAAGIPDDVWNMDARAGAVSEALEAGAEIEEVRAFAGHTDADTTRIYVRSVRQQSSRVAKQRLQGRGQ